MFKFIMLIFNEKSFCLDNNSLNNLKKREKKRMIGKFALVSTLLVSILIGNFFSKVYVPEGYEKPFAYKVQACFIKIISLSVNFLP